MTDERFDISRRKALAALGTIGVASAGAGLGTSAYFSDQETFENNQLVAGTLDMGVGYTSHYSDWSDDEGEGVDVNMYDGDAGETGTASELSDGYTGLPANDAWLIEVDDPEQFLDNTQTGVYPEAEDGSQAEIVCEDNGSGALVPNVQADRAPKPVIELDDVKPGDFGEVTFDFRICDNPGFVWINGSLQSASENGVTEPEADDPDEEEGVVELLDVVQAAVWIDDGGDGPGGNEDGNNYQNGGESPLAIGSLRDVLGMDGELTGSNGTALNGDIPAEDGGGMSDLNCFSGDTEHSIVFAWWVPVDHGNEIQSDSATFDLGLYTEQCRHNDGSGMNSDEVSDGGPNSSVTVEGNPSDDDVGNSLEGFDLNFPFDASSATVTGVSYGGSVLPAPTVSFSNGGNTLEARFGSAVADIDSTSETLSVGLDLSGVSAGAGDYTVGVVIEPDDDSAEDDTDTVTLS